jgi:cell division transport system permease protein
LFDRIEFLLGEAFVALKRNSRMAFAATTTVAVSLFLLGGLGYAYLRISQYAESIPDQFDMRVFMDEDVEVDEVRETAAAIRAIPGVRAAFWIPKDKAWELEKTKYPDLIEGLENPLPHAFKVHVDEIGQAETVGNAIGELAHVDEVVYQPDVQRFISQALSLIRWLGLGLGGLLFLTAGILIYNAIRLAVNTRRREIRTMQLVGATAGTIQTPFLIEGVIQGALGGVGAAAFLWSCQMALQTRLATLQAFGEMTPFPLWKAVVILGSIGACYGLICSALAVREPMKVGLK